MNYTIPLNFVQVEPAVFQSVLRAINYRRDAYHNALVYRYFHGDTAFGVHRETDNTYWLDRPLTETDGVSEPAKPVS